MYKYLLINYIDINKVNEAKKAKSNGISENGDKKVFKYNNNFRK